MLKAFVYQVPVPCARAKNARKHNGKGHGNGNVPFSTKRSLPGESFTFKATRPHTGTMSLAGTKGNFFTPTRAVPNRAFIKAISKGVRNIVVLYPSGNNIFQRKRLATQRKRATMKQGEVPNQDRMVRRRVLQDVYVIIRFDASRPNVLPRKNGESIYVRLVLPRRLITRRMTTRVQDHDPKIGTTFGPCVKRVSPTTVRSQGGKRIGSGAVINHEGVKGTTMSFNMKTPHERKGIV